MKVLKELVAIFSLKGNSKNFKTIKLFMYIFTIVVLIVYQYINYNIETINITLDNLIYTNGTRAYWKLGSPYVHGFIYLNYFCCIFPIFLTPFIVSVSIRVIINMCICLSFIKLQQNNPEDINLNLWIFTNYLFIIIDIAQTNVNSLIAIVFFIYYKYRNKYPLISSLSLLLCLYKINSFFILGGIIIIDFVYDRKNLMRYIAYLIPSGIIVFISLITSIEQGFFNAQSSAGFTIMNIILALQPQHIFTYSIVLYILIDKIIINQKKINIKRIWKCYGIFSITYFFIKISIMIIT